LGGQNSGQTLDVNFILFFFLDTSVGSVEVSRTKKSRLHSFLWSSQFPEQRNNYICCMEFLENVSLKSFNTFGIDVLAKKLVKIKSENDILTLIKEHQLKDEKRLVLGGGSNILLTKNFDGIVVKNELLGKEVIKEDDDFIYVKSGAGENWHEFVMWCILNNYAGLENLSLIPGNVGASPMQNIGAYGVEIKDLFHELEAISILTGEKINFNAQDCKFGYRESIFKNSYKDQFIITSVTYQLLKTPQYKITYGAIEQELERMGVQDLSIKAVSDAVINIRRSKLPDPKEIGNSGSFFKNPVIDAQLFEEIKKEYTSIVGYPSDEKDKIKVAAGWLIETAGWKGKTINNYGVHKKQALVLVNYGGATGREIFQLSEDIIHDVRKKFKITLEREVNIL
jgi:UDP-N-acetylmuramate dehydrogenase